MTDTTMNDDGSIQTRADAILRDLEEQVEMFKLRSEHLEKDANRLDAYFANLKWLVGIVSSVVVLVLFSVSFLGFSSIADLKQEVRDLVPTQVQSELRNQGELKGDAKALVAGLKELEADYARFKEWSDTLRIVSDSGDIASKDGQFAYERVDQIQKQEELTEQDRREAAVLLGSLVGLGQQGGVNPNTLFNASVVADRFDFVVEASKLASLAYGWKPSTSHRAKMLEAQDMLGISYSLDTSSKKLIDSDLSGPEAKLAAWEEMLALVSQNPRIEGEQAYSRAQNIAVRNRSQGYFTQLIDAINEAGKRDPDSISSYAYKSLAELHTWRGHRGWEAEFWIAVDKAVEKLSTESPRSSWYGHTARELLDEANRLDNIPRLVQIFKKHGLDEAAIMRAAEATGR